MKLISNRRKLASVLGTFNLGENTTMEIWDDGSFQHDEADVTMVSFVLGQSVIRRPSDYCLFIG